MAKTKWTYASVEVGPVGFDIALRLWGDDGWEAWYVEAGREIWRTIHFKKREEGTSNG